VQPKVEKHEEVEEEFVPTSLVASPQEPRTVINKKKAGKTGEDFEYKVKSFEKKSAKKEKPIPSPKLANEEPKKHESPVKVKEQRPKSAKRESVKRSITPKKEVESRSLRSRSKPQISEKKSDKPAIIEKRVSRNKETSKESFEKKVVQPEKKLEGLEKNSAKPGRKSVDRRSAKPEPKPTKS
jgi:hypothetical protein